MLMALEYVDYHCEALFKIYKRNISKKRAQLSYQKKILFINKYQITLLIIASSYHRF